MADALEDVFRLSAELVPVDALLLPKVVGNKFCFFAKPMTNKIFLSKAESKLSNRAAGEKPACSRHCASFY
jgi:hypothetical protein